MFINRNNYESFFLLFVDGELSAADRKATEEFAAANPDMQEELDLLMETVLLPENMEFEGKSSLYKAVTVDEHMQETLLLMVDDELTEKEKAAAVALIAAEPEAALEYASLLRTKSDPGEKIIYPDKHLLYRREKDNVLIGRFTRWAVAAVLLGFGLFFGIRLLNDNKAAPSSIAKGKDLPVKENIITELPAPDSQQQLASNRDIKQSKSSDTVLPINNSTVKTVPADKQKTPVAVTEGKNKVSNRQNDIAVQPSPDIKRNEVTNEVPLQVIPERQTLIVAVTELKKPEGQPENNTVSVENTYEKAVSFNEQERSGNKILYMDEDDVKRSKAGGIFRKIKRFVERTAKIKTGNSLKIASFEFAAK